jgi:ABC-type transport system involved in multi-copper enzyme maturation permease subunit
MSRDLLFAELLKIRKRWLPYILVVFLIGGAAVVVWLGGYTTWKVDSSIDTQDRQMALHTFVLPWSLVTLLDTGQYWGSVVIAVLTASAVATEYNWGTVRQALVRGQTRSQYLTTKLVGLIIVASAIMLTALAAAVAFSVLATVAAGEPVTLDAPGGPSAVDVVLMVLRAGYAILPYGLLGFCLTVVGRSTALGVAGTFMYMIAEAILLGILHGLGGVAPTIQAFTLGHNVSAVLSANVIGSENFNSLAFRNNPLPSELPDPMVGALGIAVYCVILLAITYSIFQRRDLTSSTGAT